MEAVGSVAEVGAAERAPVDIDAATMPMRIQPPMNGSIGKSGRANYMHLDAALQGGGWW